MKHRGIIPAVVLLLLALSVSALADDQKGESQLRTVRGIVIDKEENPLSGGVVYLKNLKSQAVKTYIADDEGRYRFSGLDPNVDYQIHAEHNELTSPKRTVSSFDSRKEIVIHLKVAKKKSEK